MNAMSPATITMRPHRRRPVLCGGRRSDLWRDRHIDPTCKHPFKEDVQANYHEYDVSELISDYVASLFTGGHTGFLRAALLAGHSPPIRGEAVGGCVNGSRSSPGCWSRSPAAHLAPTGSRSRVAGRPRAIEQVQVWRSVLDPVARHLNGAAPADLALNAGSGTRAAWDLPRAAPTARRPTAG